MAGFFLDTVFIVCFLQSQICDKFLIIKLYRVISEKEKEDLKLHGQLRTNLNTLEAKQFFKSKTAVLSFVKDSVFREFDPPYKYLLTIDIEEDYIQNPNFVSLKFRWI